MSRKRREMASEAGTATNEPETSSLLSRLPSRGLFASGSVCSASGGIRLYICDHETAPPENQIIKTDQTNILIRSLTIKKSKSESKAKEKQKLLNENTKGKRPAERATDDKNMNKRANTGAGSSNRKENGSKSLSEKEIQSCTVEKLRTLLKERNLPRTGKKEELIARLKKFLA